MRPRLRRPFWSVDVVSVQHLQQQVVQRHFILALHAVKVLHAFVAAVRGGQKGTVWGPPGESSDFF